MKTIEKRFHFARFLLYVNINLKRRKRLDPSHYSAIHLSLTDLSKLPF